MFHRSWLAALVAALAIRPVSASCRLQPTLGCTAKRKQPKHAKIYNWGSGSGDAGEAERSTHVIGQLGDASSSREARAAVIGRETFRGAASDRREEQQDSARIWHTWAEKWLAGLCRTCARDTPQIERVELSPADATSLSAYWQHTTPRLLHVATLTWT